jgi:hypothetical protein
MPISLGTTFWQCPECKHFLCIDGTDLAQIGVPFCDKCETGLEPQDDPIPTVLLIDGDFVGIALRPKKISRKKFESKILRLWKAWEDSDTEKLFAEWAEETHDILFLANDYIINPIIR